MVVLASGQELNVVGPRGLPEVYKLFLLPPYGRSNGVIPNPSVRDSTVVCVDAPTVCSYNPSLWCGGIQLLICPGWGCGRIETQRHPEGSI